MERSQPALACGLFTFVLASLALPLGAQSQLTTIFDCLDGKPVDIAAQRDADLDGFDKRAWIAQGRLRVAVRLSDRQRVHAEDRSFASTIQASLYGIQPTTAEQLVAVEVNEDRADGKKYLYTLTEATLYREDISDPTNPTDLVWLPLVDLCSLAGQGCGAPFLVQPWECMRDIKVWNHPTIANRGKVILLTSKRVVLIQDKDFGLIYKSSADELFDLGPSGQLNNTNDDDFNDKQVFEFWNLRIAEDGGASGAKAFISAEQGSRALPGTRGSLLILACDLDMANLSANPTFNNGTGAPGELAVTYWDPFDHAIPTPVPPSPPPTGVAANAWNALHTVVSLDAVWDPLAGVASVYAACGASSQVQRFDATDWFATGGVAPTVRLEVDPTLLEPLVEHYVLTILSDYNMVEPDPLGGFGDDATRHTQHALLAFRWSDQLASWEHVASEVADPRAYEGATLAEQTSKTARLAHVVAAAPGLVPNDWFAFVGHRDGILSVKLDAGAGTLSLASQFILADECRGVVAHEDRLFVWVDKSPAELRVYQWDRATGVISPGDLSSNGEPLGENRYVMDVGGGLISFFSGRCYRLRFFEDPNGSNGSGHLLAACEPELLRMAWPGPGGGGELPEDTLGVADVWTPENYFEPLQDCRVYDFSAVYGSANPLKILAVKNSEAFSIVDF